MRRSSLGKFGIVAAALAAATLTAPAGAEILTSVTSLNQLVRFDSATPGTISSSVGITGLQAGETLLGFDYRPATGGLYAIGSTSRLYLINTSTGAATQVGSAGAFTLSGTSFGVDFNPTVDRLRVTSNTGQNLRINPNDGTLAATDTALAYAAADPNAAATPRIVGSAYTNNFAGASVKGPAVAKSPNIRHACARSPAGDALHLNVPWRAATSRSSSRSFLVLHAASASSAISDHRAFTIAYA